MKVWVGRRRLPAAVKAMDVSAAAAVVVFVLLGMPALPTAMAAVVEHTFVVSQVNVTRLCKETLVTVVNGQLPGPAIEVTEGDSVVVHVVNDSPYNMTIHWHGVKQRLNCWADGVPMITQCPILPGHNFTYRFNVAGHEGTLWWHAHVPCLRATLHGALIIRPRHGVASYPFHPKPDKEIPIVIGEWWDMDLAQLDRNTMNGVLVDVPNGSTINGKHGDLYNCSTSDDGAVHQEDGFVLDVESGKTYLLRLMNAALFSEYFLKIAGHTMTVVASDANYVKSYATDVIAIAPGETMDVLVVTDAPPDRRYYMVAMAIQAPEPDVQVPLSITRGVVQYVAVDDVVPAAADPPAMMPDMPDQHDTTRSFYFHGNLSSLLRHRHRVPARADEHMLVTLSLGSVCRDGGQSCARSDSNESIIVGTMNDVSFRPPSSTAAAVSLLEAHYYRRDDMAGVELRELPDTPRRVFNYTDPAYIPYGPKEAPLEPTEKQTVVRRFRYGAVVEVVFQDTAVMQSDANPMHLHGHDMFVLAHGLGNYDKARDVASYNLVDPPLKNTVVVPRLGWVAVRFVADNPGTWYIHCHFDFHLSMGMVAVFIVEDGSSVDTSLPPPPMDLPKCGGSNKGGLDLPVEFYLQNEQSRKTVPRMHVKEPDRANVDY